MKDIASDRRESSLSEWIKESNKDAHLVDNHKFFMLASYQNITHIIHRFIEVSSDQGRFFETILTGEPFLYI